ncbi:uncharacterized protein METZ01_LOCUS289373, partial [marine metagenome]
VEGHQRQPEGGQGFQEKDDHHEWSRTRGQVNMTLTQLR